MGHGALRMAVMGLAERAATETELRRMERLLDAAMRAGAHGMSSGLVYPPGCFAGTDELARLCDVVARYHGIYTSHVRGERETILEAVAEAIEIGRRAGVAVEVSHNAPKWGAPEDASANLALMEAARREGHDVTTDNDVHTDLSPRSRGPCRSRCSTSGTTRSWRCSPTRATATTCAAPSPKTSCPAPATRAWCGTAASTAS